MNAQRNDPCPCGSGKKYKKCCMNRATVRASQPVPPPRPNAQALYDQALSLHRAGRLAEAVALYRNVLTRQPAHCDALHMLGAAQMQAGQFQEALHSLDEALKINSRDPGLHYNRGRALQALNRLAEALAGYERALALKPDFAEAWNNRGLILRDMQRTEEALTSFRRADEIKPGDVNVISNLVNIQRDLGRYDEALICAERARVLRPNDAAVYINMGTLLHAMGRLDDAMAYFLRAEALAPADAEAHWNEALCHLILGELRSGWEKYEWRWKKAEFARERAAFPQPPWLGREDLAGKTLLLWGEQGLGDTLQFCRYVPMLAARGVRVVLGVPPPLKRLLARLPGPVQVIGLDEPLPAFDYHCPLLSLPLVFGTTLTTIPATVPYVSAASEKVAAWRERLGPVSGRRVGLVWTGSPGHKDDRRRSIPLTELTALLGTGVDLVSLQKEVREADRAALAAQPAIHHYGDCLEDFDDTAALIANLDLVISVDTAVAHLTGALGKPVWILLPYAPDWRWLLARSDSPWYPTATLYRQLRPGDWASPIRRIVEELRR
jgi:tetratricopeptide (TPR) repeat protein